MKSLFGFFNSASFKELHETGEYDTFHEFGGLRYDHLISFYEYDDNPTIMPCNSIVTKDILAMIESDEIHFTLDGFNHLEIYDMAYTSNYTAWELWLCLNIGEFFDKVIFHDLPSDKSWYKRIKLSYEDYTLLLDEYDNICNFREKYGLKFKKG